MARKRGFGQLTKLPSGRIRQTEHGYVPGSPSASRKPNRYRRRLGQAEGWGAGVPLGCQFRDSRRRPQSAPC